MRTLNNKIMRVVLALGLVMALVVTAAIGIGYYQYNKLFPKASTEVVELTPVKRDHLKRLRAESKFRPNDYPPLGYTGMSTSEDELKANMAVNGVIDAILVKPDGPIKAKDVASLLGEGMKSVDLLDTEDRGQVQNSMVEIWYIMGFKGATGRFAYGSAYTFPPGYGEPLPNGWTDPTHPRSIPLP